MAGAQPQITHIIVHDAQVNQETGYVTYTVKTRTTEGKLTWDGPLVQYGVDAQALRDRFNGDLAEWEAYVAKEHQALTGVHVAFVDAVIKRIGAVIG